MSKIEKNSVADIMRNLHGGEGLNIKIVVTVVCESPVRDGKACCACQKAQMEFEESKSQSEILKFAKSEFRKIGWRFGRNGARCPSC